VRAIKAGHAALLAVTKERGMAEERPGTIEHTAGVVVAIGGERKETMGSGAMHSSPLPPFARDFRQINVARGGNEDAQGTASRAGD